MHVGYEESSREPVENDRVAKSKRKRSHKPCEIDKDHGRCGMS